MEEKKLIEKLVADKFITFYNNKFGADYKITELSENPDIRCRDSKNNELNIEITLTEDEDGDIKALLGRSGKLNIDTFRMHLENVKKGKEEIRSYSVNNSNEILIARIKKKIKNNYGRNTALVIYDTSGIGWDREISLISVKELLNSISNPFDRGIWVVLRLDNSVQQLI